jgi:hypothetical protein
LRWTSSLQSAGFFNLYAAHTIYHFTSWELNRY